MEAADLSEDCRMLFVNHRIATATAVIMNSLKMEDLGGCLTTVESSDHLFLEM